MKVISANTIHNALLMQIPRLANVLPRDVRVALEQARENETNERAQIVLDQLIENAKIASSDHVPLCQDTGSVWVCLEVGPDVSLNGNVFATADEAVAIAYKNLKLRKSIVKDALFDRTNTETNTPAFCELRFAPFEPGVCRLHIMLKGGGSDNASRVVMLPPSAGKQGVIDEVVKCVKEKAANACPPLVIGVGVGSTFDKVPNLAKRAMMRPLDVESPDPEVAAFEKELLEAVNATGVGPGALGGNTTALGVRLMTAPCHIAALPVAINMGCCAMRRITVEL